MKIAFDIDDTLWKCTYPFDKRKGRPYLKQVPDYDLIQVIRWFYQNGDEIFFWSAGGIDYCETIIANLGLSEYGTVVDKGSFTPDIAFDDQETKLGKIDIRVKRDVIIPEKL